MGSLNKIISKEELKESIFSLYENGLPTGCGSGIKSLDNLVRWELGRLSVVTGAPNYGKSEFLDFLNLRLNQQQGWKVAIWSPENFPSSYHTQKFVSKIVNKEFDKTKLSVEELGTAVNYVCDNFFFMNYETVGNITDILNTTLELITKEDIKVLVIDPFNRLENQRPSKLIETEYISQLLDELSNFAKKHQILIHLVAHPRKLQKDTSDGSFQVPTYYDINGSANFANKADYCLTVHRNFMADLTEIHVQKVKFRNLGQIGICDLKYDLASGNYYEDESNDNDLQWLCTSNEKHKSNEKEGLTNDSVVISERIKEYLKTHEETHKKANSVNILDVEVSYFDSAKDNVPKSVNLHDFLSKKKENINLPELRQNPQFKELKKDLPCVTISGLFKDKRSIDNLERHSGLLCVDIDKKDNSLPMDSIFLILKSINNIAYVGKSCSGKGLFAVVPIANPKEHKAHFEAIKHDLAKQGIVIDNACIDVSRLRFYSYDETAHYNLNATPYTNLKHRETPTHAESIEVDINDPKIKNMLKDISEQKLNVADSYTAWFEIGCALQHEFDEEGRTMYHLICQYYPEYNKAESDDMYDNCLNHAYIAYNLATVYHYYKLAKQKVKHNIQQ